MKAITYTSFGPATDVLTLTDLPTPDPGPGEVLVEIAISGVNPSDVKARAGARPGVIKPPFPTIIPHSDGAGVIAAVGDGVDSARIGTRVWVWNGQWQRAFGTCASHICVPEAQAVAMDPAISFETGAQLGIPGLTAAHAVFSFGDVAGKTVLVNGAAGTVGYLATQLAKWGGAQVIATAREETKDRVLAAGADHVLDYRSDNLAEAILDTAGGPVHHIVEVEFGRNADTDAAVIAENGTICAYGSAQAMRPEMPFYPLMFKSVQMHMALIYLLPPAPRLNAIDRLNRAFASHALNVPVETVFALSDTPAAHAAVEAGGRAGGVLVWMP